MAMTLRTDSVLEEALELLVREEGLSRQEIVRRAVLERAEKVSRRNRLASLTEEALDEWSETLARLGSE
ncbi:ribbon-helix-helix protein, CopG family [Demequina sp. SYSU T00192]|uniref:Ribbon-helix-helix protein, CopG family n=1 Tax=Demequina litoralis TaxID=3051660 RepID=A0ABT8GD88_9MICO|nr:ribbon-helix-helix protein, CopG family [Demequina sp. SYSU T00192]MDN4476947.1 ribbon-helix-helix protein, CopG family [Demequina sp. SYSU T00192]